jgi:hypothetical protein
VIAAGANPKKVAARAEHTSVSFTLDRYGHLIRTPIRRSGTAWTPCMPSPQARRSARVDGPETDQAAARGRKGYLSHRRTGCDLLGWLVGVTGLEPVTSSL